jgi:hypothetical protein
LNTTNTSINKNSIVNVFNNVKATGGIASNGDLDTGNASIVKQIVFAVRAVRDFENEILTIDGVEIPLKKTVSDVPFTNGGAYSVVSLRWYAFFNNTKITVKLSTYQS